MSSLERFQKKQKIRKFGKDCDSENKIDCRNVKLARGIAVNFALSAMATDEITSTIYNKWFGIHFLQLCFNEM